VSNEFSAAFSTAYDPTSGGTGMDICYPNGTDWGCSLNQQQIDSLDPDVKARAEALAWTTLSSLLAYRLSLCPITVRPCALGCSGQTWVSAPSSSSQNGWSPYVSGGTWFNGCGCTTDCSCTSLSEALLPTGVGAIQSVWLDGIELAPATYRVDNGNRLVRTDGESWPSCQDMSISDPVYGGFFVSYWSGIAPNDLLRYAAGLLANEFYKACTGGKCSLPSSVTMVARQGVTMEIATGLFLDGSTGIRQVDAIIRIYNPNGLKTPPRVLSPDKSRARITTWSA
jgi:hypothetical protein